MYKLFFTSRAAVGVSGMLKFLIIACFIMNCLSAHGQDTTRQIIKPATKDSLPSGRPVHESTKKIVRPEKRKLEYFKDTIRRERRKFDSTLFTTINIPTTGDYARDLGKVYQTLSDIPGVTASFSRLESIDKNLDSEDSALVIVGARLSQNDRTFNVRNLQMMNTLLDAIDKNTDDYSETLEIYDSLLDDIGDQITSLQNDTLMRNIFRDTALKKIFQPQLLQLKSKWREVDSVVSENGKEISTLKSQASAHSIRITELSSRVDFELKAVGSRAFGKEQPYLWESEETGRGFSTENFLESMQNERDLAKFYFVTTRNNRVWLLLSGILFFIWVSNNFRTLKKANKMDVTSALEIDYINPVPIAASLIFMLSLAPLFDLHAPALYIEFVQLLILIVLTFIFWKRLSPRELTGWCAFILLFLMLSVGRLLFVSITTQRWLNLFINSASLLLGIYFFIYLKGKHGKWISFAIALYTFFNLLAIVMNLCSRVTLSQIFAYTAVYSFAEIINLGVFVHLIIESFLLQVQTSRIRKNYPQGFDINLIKKSVRRFSMFIAVFLWLIVFAINLNLFDSLFDILSDLFTRIRKVGNFSFTIGGILLFLGIIWLANFLQKYISYFFGDTGDDAAFDDKGQRSRLMVTRLILLIAGFLLAVAASGLAVDRITVILGALGVGVGLGLQNIVNNFVSGIILIFDRPLRIGDTVDIGDKRGRVKEIGVRSSTLLTEDGAEVIIPNGDVLSHNIVNWTLSNNHARIALTFTLDKPKDPGQIDIEAIRNLVKENSNVLQQREPEVSLNSVNTKSAELKVLLWIIDFNKEETTASEVKSAIYAFLESKAITVN
jgi:potassium-dependent mechanosensitive channel